MTTILMRDDHLDPDVDDPDFVHRAPNGDPCDDPEAAWCPDRCARCGLTGHATSRCPHVNPCTLRRTIA